MGDIEKLKIEVFDLREKLQVLAEQCKLVQDEINDKVLKIRELENKK